MKMKNTDLIIYLFFHLITHALPRSGCPTPAGAVAWPSAGPCGSSVPRTAPTAGIGRAWRSHVPSCTAAGPPGGQRTLPFFAKRLKMRKYFF